MRFKKRSFNLREFTSYSNVFLFLVGILIIIAGYALQKTLIFSPDVNYLIYASSQLWKGGHYGKEIFETNPPMILFLYLPVNFLHQFIFSNIPAALHWYMLMLGLISTGISFVLLKKIIPHDRFYRNVIILTYLFVIFCLPVYAFGQREHIFLILIFPYLMSVALFLEKKPLNVIDQILISLLAALGFAIKPFFLIPLIFIECYVIFKEKNIFAAFRLSNIVIMLVFLLYLASIIFWQKGYLDIIFPLVMKYYFPSVIGEWMRMIFHYNFIFCIAMVVAYFVFFKNDAYQSLGVVICLGLIGALLSYIIPKQLWYYHFYPAFGLAFLLMMHCIKQLSIQPGVTDRLSIAFQLLVFIAMFQIVAFYPVSDLTKMILLVQADKKDMPKGLQNFMYSKEGEHSVFCFSLYTFDCFSMMPESKIRFAESFPSFWWLNGLLKEEKNDPNNKALAEDRKFLIDRVSEDLAHLKARWVIVNQDVFKYYQGRNFNIMDYLSQNEKFKEAIKHYRFVRMIDLYSVYEREESDA